MIDESTTNSQITDSVTQSTTSVIGHAPASTQGLLDAVMAETVGMSMHNAVTAQQNSQMMSNAAVAATCARLIKAPVILDPQSSRDSSAPNVDQILGVIDAALFANQTLLRSDSLEDPELAGFEAVLQANQAALAEARTDLAGIKAIVKAEDPIVKLLDTELENQLAMLGDAQHLLNQIGSSPPADTSPPGDQIQALDALGVTLDRSSGKVRSLSNVLKQLNSAADAKPT